MFVKIVEPEDYEEIHTQEEHRLLEQLTRIDRRLRSKTDGNGDNDDWKLWGQQKQAEEFGNHKWVSREKQHIPIYSANMEYFSQINTEENDDDSLFDPHNNILNMAKNQPHPHVHRDRKQSNGYYGKENLRDGSKALKQSSSQDRIIKEINYAYKKETQPINKASLPPRNSKQSNSKGSIMPPKSQRKGSTANLRRSETTPSTLINNAQNRDKYKEKQMIVEQKDSLDDDPSEFKFHTFEVCLENKNEQPSKSNKKCLKLKNQQQDKVSLECTFKPTILKRSAQMAKSTKNVVERLSTSGQPNKEKKPYQHQIKTYVNKNRLQQLSQPRRLKTQVQDKEQEVPSFRPSLSKKSLEHMSNCTYDVATRNQLWLREREEKIERLRLEEERQKEKRQNCTYSPSLCQYKGENAPNLSRFGRQGIENYFERLSTNNRSSIRSKHTDSFKENKHSDSNMSKQTYSSKGTKKQKYQDAVKQLHNRIMGLKI